MKEYFNINDSIYKITEKYPETIDVLVASGFDQFKDEGLRKQMGKNITLDMALKSKKINKNLLVNKLNEVIKDGIEVEDISLVEKTKKENVDIRIDGIVPCPIRVPLLESFDSWLEEKQEKEDLVVEYELKSANFGTEWIEEKMKLQDEENSSDLFLSAGFDLFFDDKLMGRFKNTSYFEDLTDFEKLNDDFDNEYIDLKDPDKEYSIMAVVPAVFLVNKEELDGREMPKSWSDLLKEEFEDSISLPMHDLDLFNAILLTIYKEYGEEGIKKLGKSLLKSMHPSEMVKSHIKKGKKPTVTIMPYFFTKMIKKDGPLVSVWPKEGAIVSPIFLLAKRKKREKIKPFVDYFFSKEVAEVLSHNGRFPSIHPQIDNGLGEEEKFIWLGWDFIKNNDIGALIKECSELFQKSI